jgi:hypothetical protein
LLKESELGSEEIMLFHCKDCGVDTLRVDEYYMVHDDIWAAHGGGDGMLCIGCLETCMGRTLSPTDFTDAGCNRYPDGYSKRLEDRLGGPGRDRSAEHIVLRLKLVQKAGSISDPAACPIVPAIVPELVPLG